MKRLVAAVLFCLLATTDAAAQSPAPTLVRFDTFDPPGQYTGTFVEPSAGCPFDKPFPNFTPAFSAPTYLYAPCKRTLRLTFPTPKASVQLFASVVIGAAPILRVTGHTVTGQTLTVEVANPSQWRPVTLAPPAGVGAIDYVDLRAEGADVGVDDLAISTAPQPDSVLSGGPTARSEVTEATFEFAANRPDVAGFRCSLDGAAPTPCSSPLTLTGLAPGAHTFRVATVDAYGAVDASPAERTWTVLGPAPETPVRDGATPVVTGEDATIDFGLPGVPYECSLDGGPFTACATPHTMRGLAPGPHTLDVRALNADGRPDPTPQRYAFEVPGGRSTQGAGANEADVDRDRIPDSQETLPLGNVPPVAGVRTLVTLLSGTVYVKLPGKARFSQAGPLPGFVPLKGIAALPVGTIVDARRGRLALQSAGDGRPATDPRRRLGRVTLAQAIFQIRQARLRRAALRARAIPTSLVIASAPDIGRGCRARVPAKGAVRSLTSRAKGLFRVTGGASRGQSTNATWRTTDYCSGTVTRVTRGRVSVYDKARRRTVTVRAGQRYVARAQLFQARKGRGTR
jgi:hypothetical protein